MSIFFPYALDSLFCFYEHGKLLGDLGQAFKDRNKLEFLAFSQLKIAPTISKEL